jgi:hypothetical protein
MSRVCDHPAVVIPFPRRGASDRGLAGEDRRFLLRTAQVLEERAERIGDDLGLLRFHTAVDLRRPRLHRLLSRLDHPETRYVLDDLNAVSYRSGMPIEDQLLAARRLATAAENAATG